MTATSEIEQPFSNVQLELLKLFSDNVSDEDLLAIKELLSRYFAEKAMDKMDEIWEDKKLSNKTMDEWLNEENQ